MRKAILGVAAVGAVFALRHVTRSAGHGMRRHCEQMMSQLAARQQPVNCA